MRALAVGGDWRLLCSTVMPDHIHILFELGTRLTIGQIVGKLKTQTRDALKRVDAHWQRDYFEHRLRPGELANNFARYAFLNPYRENLISRRDEWPYWHIGRDVMFDFMTLLEAGRFPPSAWLSADAEELGLMEEQLGEA